MTEPTDSGLSPGDLSVGDTGPEITVEDLERRDFVRYAGASGDFNPVHYDEPYAKDAGYPGTFGQGMLTAGFASRVAADWFGLANVDRFRVRFESQVWPGDTLTATGEVTELHPTEDGIRVDATLRVINQADEEVVTGDVTATVSE